LVFLTGLFLCMGIILKYAFLIMALFFLIFFLLRRKFIKNFQVKLVVFICPFILIAILFMAYNSLYFANPFAISQSKETLQFAFNFNDILKHFVSPLFSKNKGLLTFSPILLFAFCGFYFLGRNKDRTYAL